MAIAPDGRVRYARREARAILSANVTVSTGRGPCLSGRAVDVSRHGVGVELTRPVLPGTRVEVTVESLSADEWEEPMAMSATVCVSRHVDRKTYRLGLVVARLPGRLEEFVRDAATATTVLQAVRPDDFSLRSALCREVLYQAACDRLAAREYDAALSAAICAVEGDPENRLYRAVMHRAAGEAALMSGLNGEALWHLMKAHAYAPSDPQILARLSLLRTPVPVAWAA